MWVIRNYVSIVVFICVNSGDGRSGVFPDGVDSDLISGASASPGLIIFLSLSAVEDVLEILNVELVL